MALIAGDARADKVVPPTGFTASLTLFSAAAMAFLAVFALALSLATDRLADRWGEDSQGVRRCAYLSPRARWPRRPRRRSRCFGQTPGIASARVLSDDEQRALLEPWFGPDLPVERLPIPRLIEIVEEGEGYDAAGLRLRLTGRCRCGSRRSYPLAPAAGAGGRAPAPAGLAVDRPDRRHDGGDDHARGQRGAGRQRAGDPRAAAGGGAGRLHRPRLRAPLHPAGALRCRGGNGGAARRSCCLPGGSAGRLPDRPRLSRVGTG